MFIIVYYFRRKALWGKMARSTIHNNFLIAFHRYGTSCRIDIGKLHIAFVESALGSKWKEYSRWHGETTHTYGEQHGPTNEIILSRRRPNRWVLCWEVWINTPGVCVAFYWWTWEKKRVGVEGDCHTGDIIDRWLFYRSRSAAILSFFFIPLLLFCFTLWGVERVSTSNAI